MKPYHGGQEGREVVGLATRTLWAESAGIQSKGLALTIPRRNMGWGTLWSGVKNCV